MFSFITTMLHVHCRMYSLCIYLTPVVAANSIHGPAVSIGISTCGISQIYLALLLYHGSCQRTRPFFCPGTHAFRIGFDCNHNYTIAWPSLYRSTNSEVSPGKLKLVASSADVQSCQP